MIQILQKVPDNTRTCIRSNEIIHT
uniref:Uncharacterized protein n=1 Tax=Arundo donax TaxID=35708 RepID=A0A0A9A7L5_ARUDO